MFRKMRRFKQQLSNDEALEILKNCKSGVLAVSGDDGYPYTVPLNFVYADGKCTGSIKYSKRISGYGIFVKNKENVLHAL